MITKHRIVEHGICFALCFALLFLIFSTFVSAEERELQPIRVGFFEFDGYHMMDENGNRSGYGYELLQHMVGYTNWTYEYIGYDKSWSEMQEMLANGEIDILTSAQKTDERMQKFDFSQESIGTSAAILTVKAGSSEYALSEYENWSGIRVGMLRDNSRNGDFAEFAAENNFTYSPVYYNDSDEMVSQLKNGDQIDAILTSNLRSIEGEWILAEFNASPFYVMVRKSDDKLLAQINNALEHMNIDEPGFRTKLMNKYYTPDSGDDIAFTTEERKYIEHSQNESLTTIVNPDRAPYSSYNSNGEPVGIISDIVDIITERSGLNIDFLVPENRNEYTRLTHSGEVDIRFDAWHNYDEEESLGYRLTAPYLDVSVSRLYKRTTKSFDSVALPKNSDLARKYSDYFTKKYDDIAYYDTIDDVIDAVKSGKQDLAYLYSGCADLAIQSDVTNGLTEEDCYGYYNSFAVAVNEKQDEILFSIINKTVASIHEDDIQKIVQKHTAYTEKSFSIVGYIYDNPLALVGIVILLFLIAALIVLAIFQSKKRKRESEQLLEEKRRSQLLSDALAAAESANIAKSRFLSSVSHEMRTPLNAIIGFLSLANDTLTQDNEADMKQLGDYLGNSETAANQLLSVINDVLDMSSIESGKMALEQSPFNIRQTLDNITGIYSSQCREKSLKYETEFTGSVDEWCIGDQLRVNQILMNLLSNAVKFTKKGHIKLLVTQLDAQKDKIFIRFEVSDTGCGISEEMQERLFKPFEQGSSATARKYGGSGLGLSIVKTLVTMMGGAVRVESHLNEGSIFTVDLPFTKADTGSDKLLADEIESLEASSSDNNAADYDFSGKRILLAEDNILNRKVVSELLKKAGIECESAEDGQITADKFTASAAGYYDAVLMDIQMPNVDGFEATEIIRSSSHTDAKTVPIIALTANAFNEDIAKTLSSGMNYHVAKPIDPNILFSVLNKAFKKY